MTADTLDTLASQIKARQRKAHDFQTSAVLQMAEARKRVEAGEAGDVSWPEWVVSAGLGDAAGELAMSPMQAAAARFDAAVTEIHAAISGYLGVCAQARSEYFGRTGRSNAHLDSADRVRGLLLANSVTAELVGASPTAGAPPSLKSQHSND